MARGNKKTAQGVPTTSANGMPLTPDQGKMLQNIAATEMDQLQLNEQARQQIDEKMRTEPKIGVEQVRRASQILKKYKDGKKNLEKKLIANEEFWRLRQWRYMNSNQEDFVPATSWLWSCIVSRYSDTMDSYPTCNVQPRQEDDKAEAKSLSSIIPVIMEQNRYEEVYSDIAWYALKQGGAVQGVFWDATKHNGLGDISIKKIDFINLYWEPGIMDIQKSSNVFNIELVDNEILEHRYPQTAGHLGGKGFTPAHYFYDENVDTTDKSIVVEWYYHTEDQSGKRVLQYCKYVNDIVLYATENMMQPEVKRSIDPITGVPVEQTEPSIAERGLYDHGMYPFVVLNLYPVEGSLCGYGLTDIARDTQLSIDALNKAVLDNAKANASPRYFVKDDGSVNMKEFSDVTCNAVHVAGQVGEENIRQITPPQMSAYPINYLQMKIDEMKYITSNNDSSNGVTSSGVTAASAIAALQEAAGKNARSSNKEFYRAYRDVVYMVIELIRQFYDIPRTFRIAPDVSGQQEQFVQYNNAGLVPQQQSLYGADMGLRLPEFDIDVTAEKADPYKKMEVNELALNFYNLGFFNPQMSDQAIACLQMMDFPQKDQVIQRVQANGTLLQMMLQYQMIALQLAQKYEPDTAEQISQLALDMQGASSIIPGQDEINLQNSTSEDTRVTNARAQTQAATQVQ